MNIFGGVENKFLPGIHLEATKFESFVEHFSLKWPFFYDPRSAGKVIFDYFDELHIFQLQAE